MPQIPPCPGLPGAQELQEPPREHGNAHLQCPQVLRLHALRPGPRGDFGQALLSHVRGGRLHDGGGVLHHGGLGQSRPVRAGIRRPTGSGRGSRPGAHLLHHVLLLQLALPQLLEQHQARLLQPQLVPQLLDQLLPLLQTLPLQEPGELQRGRAGSSAPGGNCCGVTAGLSPGWAEESSKFCVRPKSSTPNPPQAPNPA